MDENIPIPCWFLASEVGVITDPNTGAKRLPDGYGVTSVFHGLDPCIPLFSSQQAAIAFSMKHNLAGVRLGTVSDKAELRDMAAKFQVDYVYFILDPETKNGLARIASIIGSE